MTSLVVAPQTLQAVPAPMRYRFTVAEFEQMIAAKVWRAEERLELIDGEIVAMSPINVPHAIALTALMTMFFEQAGQRVVIWNQNPIQLSDGTRPQPDLCLLRPPRSAYKQLPQAADVLLLVEVSDSTARYDREIKVPRYALAGIPEVWVIDLTQAQVFVYAQPQGGQYQVLTSYGHGQTLAPMALPEVWVPTDEVLISG